MEPTRTDQAAYERLEAAKLFYETRTPDRAHLRGAIIATAEAFDGIREIKTTNTGHWINKFHRDIGLDPGLYWCLMYVQYVYKWACSIWDLPDILPYNVAGTQRLWDWAEREGLVGVAAEEFGYGDIVIWRNGMTSGGHTGIVVYRDDSQYATMEGNVGANWRDGGGVERRVQPYDKWGTVGVPREHDRWTRGVIKFDALFDRYLVAA